MEIKDLRLFVTVADQHNMARAARCLHLSQPTVTYHITKLEEEIGHKLLNRNPHGVSLTDRGIQLRALAASLLPIVDNGELLFAGEKAAARRQGVVRMGLARMVYKFIYPSIMPAFSAGLPDVGVLPIQAPSRRCLDILWEGRADFVLTFSEPQAGAAFGDQVVSYDDYVAVCGPRHPLLAAGPVLADELLRYPLLLVNKSLTLRCVEAHFHRQGVQPRIVLMPSPEDLLRATALGHGFTLFSRLGFRFLCEYVQLRPIPVQDVQIRRALRLFYRVQAPLARQVTASLRSAIAVVVQNAQDTARLRSGAAPLI